MSDTEFVGVMIGTRTAAQILKVGESQLVGLIRAGVFASVQLNTESDVRKNYDLPMAEVLEVRTHPEVLLAQRRRHHGERPRKAGLTPRIDQLEDQLGTLAAQVAEMTDLLRQHFVQEPPSQTPDADVAPPPSEETPPAQPSDMPRAEGDQCPEDGCTGTLRRKQGKFGDFWGCTNWRRTHGCEFSEKVRA